MRIQFGLLDNALDYLNWAAEHATEDDDRNWKQALLNLAAGVELLLKARLEKEHWSLLFQNVDRASLRTMETGEFVSVDASNALSRLDEIAGVTFAEPEQRTLKLLRDLRNRVQHFAFDIEHEAVTAVLASGLSLAVDFCHDELSEDIDGDREVILTSIMRHAGDFNDFVEARLTLIGDQVASAPAVLDCPNCGIEGTLMLGGGRPECAFCRSRFKPEHVAEFGDGPFPWLCLECGEGTILCVIFSNEWAVGLCTSCGTWQQHCLDCGHEFTGRENRCPRCGAAQG